MKNHYSATFDERVTVFLPCRAGSERIPNKNTKIFAGIDGGVLTIKLRQLVDSTMTHSVILSTNDSKVIEIAESFGSDKIVFDRRPEELATSKTSTDELINYVPKVIQANHILWTHVTSPFIDAGIYDEAIAKYFLSLKESSHDSLMAVNKMQTFLWEKGKPINYNREHEKWPRTQTLPVYYEINSGFFISSRQNYINYEDRIGMKPFLFELKSTSSFDIDWPDDFELAEMIFKKKYD